MATSLLAFANSHGVPALMAEINRWNLLTCNLNDVRKADFGRMPQRTMLIGQIMHMVKPEKTISYSKASFGRSKTMEKSKETQYSVMIIAR